LASASGSDMHPNFHGHSRQAQQSQQLAKLSVRHPIEF
jgi:hypothetical protein